MLHSNTAANSYEGLQQSIIELVPLSSYELQESNSCKADLTNTHKKKDIANLVEIDKSINQFIALPVGSNYDDILKKIGDAAKLIHFNDQHEGCHDYIRNKYGSIDRSKGGQHRGGDLRFVQLEALRYLDKLNLRLISDQNSYEILKEGLTVLQAKIQGVINLENSDVKPTPIQVLKVLEDNEAAQKADARFCKLIDYYYAEILIDRILKILEDNNLENLDLNSRDDRYYLGMTLAMIGELSKDLKNSLSSGKEGGLFSFFKKIRDKRLAHSSSTFVQNLDDYQLQHLNYLLNILFLVSFKNNVVAIQDALKTHQNSIMDFNPDLKVISDSVRPLLKNLVASIFGRKVEHNHKVDNSSTVLNALQTLKKLHMSDQLENTSKPKNNCLTILNQIKMGIQYKVDPQKMQNLLLQYNNIIDKPQDAVAKFTDVTVIPTLDEVTALILAAKKPKTSAISSFGILLKRIRLNVTKYYKFNESKKPEHVRNLPALQRNVLQVIEEFNKTIISNDLKFASTKEVPSLEQVNRIIGVAETLNLDIIASKASQEEDVLSNEVKNITINTSTNTNSVQTKIELQGEGEKESAALDKDRAKAAAREKLSIHLKIISHEFNYVIEVIGKDSLNEIKKDLILRFALTKIGQILRDIEKETELILAAYINEDHKESIQKTIQTRHKLMHDIIASIKLSISDTLFHQTLPMIPEINALRNILKKEDKENDGKTLLKLGRAYIILKQYDRAIECFNKMMLLSRAELLVTDDLNTQSTEKELFNKYTNSFNSLRGMALIYEAMIYDAIVENRDPTPFQTKRIAIYQQYLRDMKDFGLMNKLPSQLASTYNNLGNAYSETRVFDQAVDMYKKALKTLSLIPKVDQIRRANCLSNLGIAFVQEMEYQLETCVEKKYISTESIEKMRLATVCLKEAKMLFEEARQENISHIFYIKVLISLFKGLVWTCGTDPSGLRCLYAKELYNLLDNKLKTSILSESSQELQAIDELLDFVKIINEISVEPRIVEQFNRERKLVEAEMNIQHLLELQTFYAELSLDYNLDDRINESVNYLKSLPTKESLTQEILCQLEIGIHINRASLNLRKGNPSIALKGYEKALTVLERDYQDFLPDILANLLENIGDTYSALGQDGKAVEFFTKSMEAHYKYVPNDRAFQIPGKIIRLNNKVDNSYQKNYALVKEILQKLTAKVGDNDPRLDDLKIAYNKLSSFLSKTLHISKNDICPIAKVLPSIEKSWFEILSSSYNSIVNGKNKGKALTVNWNFEVPMVQSSIEDFRTFLRDKLDCGEKDFGVEESGNGKLCITLETEKAARSMEKYICQGNGR